MRGWGMTVLRIIEDRSWRTLPLFTPGTALDVARDFYWYGEEDEETALQESWGDDADAREEMRAGHGDPRAVRCHLSEVGAAGRKPASTLADATDRGGRRTGDRIGRPAHPGASSRTRAR